MLHLYLLKWDLIKFIQLGYNIDYIVKNSAIRLVSRVLIFMGFIFGEKYIVEYITKKSIDGFIFNNNRFIGLNSLAYSYYFIQILTSFIYLLVISNLFILFI